MTVRSNDTEGQLSVSDYVLPEVRIRLRDGEALYSDSPLSSPEDAARTMGSMMKALDREYLCVANLDVQNRPINYSIVSMGDSNSCPVNVSNIFKAAILSNAASIILFHNHPSGSVAPSQEDVNVTAKVREAARLLDIRMLDHIIIGGGSGDMYSFLRNDPKSITGDKYYGVSEAKARYDTNDRIKELTDKLEDGVKNLFYSDRYKDYLRTMSRFHNYSFNNCLLIMMQKPDASYVAGYSSWRKDFERQVRKGEKGIRIIAPAPYKIVMERDKTDPATKQPVIGTDGRPVKETYEKTVPAYKAVTVFDISQTDGKPLPEIAKELKDGVKNTDDIIAAIRDVSPVPVEFQEINGSAKGYYTMGDEKKIVIKKGMSDSQTIKTAIHELAHAVLHDKETGSEKDALPDRQTREVQAESVAFITCSHLGIDTSDYSFGYIAQWGSRKDTTELKNSLQTIQKASADIINKLDARLKAKEQTLQPRVISESPKIHKAIHR